MIHVDKGTVRVDGIKLVIMSETCTLLRALREKIGNDELEKVISDSRKSEKEITEEAKEHLVELFEELLDKFRGSSDDGEGEE